MGYVDRDKEMPNLSLSGNETAIAKRQNLLKCQSLAFGNRETGQIEILKNVTNKNWKSMKIKEKSRAAISGLCKIFFVYF